MTTQYSKEEIERLDMTAAMAMEGILASGKSSLADDAALPCRAYDIAEGMLAEGKKRYTAE